jgi:hypothetical protein
MPVAICLTLCKKNYSQGTGLVPDFIRQVNDPVPVKAVPGFKESEFDGEYFNNACRVPWRLGVDELQKSHSDSRAFLDRINLFILRVSKADTASVYAGYRLEGGSLNDNNENFYSAPFAVAAMIDKENQKWLNDLWRFVTASHQFMEHPKDLDYFGDNIRMIDAVIISGNYWPAFKKSADL